MGDPRARLRAVRLVTATFLGAATLLLGVPVPAQAALTANLGWGVTVQSSNLAHAGTHAGTAIPAADLSVTSAAAPVRPGGQAVDPVGGPRVPATSPMGALDSSPKLLEAMATYGNGAYTQLVGLSLTGPGTSAAGTYAATVTTTTGTGP